MPPRNRLSLPVNGIVPASSDQESICGTGRKTIVEPVSSPSLVTPVGCENLIRTGKLGDAVIIVDETVQDVVPFDLSLRV